MTSFHFADHESSIGVENQLIAFSVGCLGLCILLLTRITKGAIGPDPFLRDRDEPSPIERKIGPTITLASSSSRRQVLESNGAHLGNLLPEDFS